MKHLELKTLQYRILEKSYADRLKTLHYSESGTYYMPLHIRDFLHFIENRGITDINQITDQDINGWINRLKNRKNRRRTGGISPAHINKHISALNNFARYLTESETGNIPSNTPYLKDKDIKKTNILSIEEIQTLYESCQNTIFDFRDRAMLSVYYGCGLRKREGINLNTENILFNKKLLHVTKSKNGRERLVPMSPAVMQNISDYINRSRPLLLNQNQEEKALFINRYGNRLKGHSMAASLKRLLAKAEIKKTAGLHTLRHSIATHLLQSGMKLEDIGKFLGHQSLDSTQLYTHLANEQQ